MKISIIGAGAMGSLFGGYLSNAGNDVILYDVNKEHVEKINKDGLTIEELSNNEKKKIKVRATTKPQKTMGSDVFIIFVKSTVTKKAAESFKEYANDNTIFVTLQNGYGNEDILKNIFGSANTAAGVTSQGATFAGPGYIKHAGNGSTYISMSDKNNQKLSPFAKTLNAAGFETIIEQNIESLVWSKLIINVGINALTALTGFTNGELLKYKELKETMKALVDEATMVSSKLGIKLSYDNPIETVYNVAEKTSTNRSSMLQDFDRKNRTEIDFINNAIVKIAEEIGLNVPVNKTITNMVKAIDLSRT